MRRPIDKAVSETLLDHEMEAILAGISGHPVPGKGTLRQIARWRIMERRRKGETAGMQLVAAIENHDSINKIRWN